MPKSRWAAACSIALLVASCEVGVETTLTESIEPAVWPVAARWGFSGEELRFETSSGVWVLQDSTDAAAGRVVLQDARNDSPVFNVLLNELTATDLELEVRLRSVSGEIDRGGGLVWRAKDGENYYIARFNPLEDNYRVYTVVDGVRTQLASAHASVPEGAWCTLTVRMVKDRIECALDGETLLEVRDTTFAGGGRIGLWTKADARTEFDDLVLRTREP